MSSPLKKKAVQSIRDSYNVLSSAKDLSPENDRINESLTRLVGTLTQCQEPELSRFLLNTPELAVERERLPELCGQAECEMEKFWTRKLIDSPACDLKGFWYYAEYSELCKAEMELFKDRTFDRITFLGAGALPLTAFMLARDCPDTKITCVDFDAEACELAEKLCHRLGLQDQVDMRYMDALEHVPGENELVICASLLQGREEVYKRLSDHDCALIVRDSEGPYRYLYKAAELPKSDFRQVAKTDIDPRRINTSRYYERKHSYAKAA